MRREPVWTAIDWWTVILVAGTVLAIVALGRIYGF